eukprot:TRINITY_DN2416_c0_g2_i1.p1 TRINITY_DN2416_c0_g2~~TRINITY_DN2416_c0_g2_i1.p1  ORF type:complete len:317 (-),score=54.08 TRINITY_DN2416_c0_g2_i1:90-1040(-)
MSTTSLTTLSETQDTNNGSVNEDGNESEISEDYEIPEGLDEQIANTLQHNLGGPTNHSHTSERVILNIGGTRFETYVQTLLKYPDTLLGVMFNERNADMLKPDSKGEYFFDRSPIYFEAILHYYRTGKLRCPPGVLPRFFEDELIFWQIPSSLAKDSETLGEKVARKALSSARRKVGITLSMIVNYIQENVKTAARDGKQSVVLEFKQSTQIQPSNSILSSSPPPTSDFYSFLSNFSNRELLLHDLLDQHLDVGFTDVTSGQGHSYILTITLWNRYTRQKAGDTMSNVVTKILEELRQGVEVKTAKNDHILYVKKY